MATYNVRAVDGTTGKVEWTGTLSGKTQAAVKGKVTRMLCWNAYRHIYLTEIKDESPYEIHCGPFHSEYRIALCRRTSPASILVVDVVDAADERKAFSIFNASHPEAKSYKRVPFVAPSTGINPTEQELEVMAKAACATTCAKRWHPSCEIGKGQPCRDWKEFARTIKVGIETLDKLRA